MRSHGWCAARSGVPSRGFRGEDGGTFYPYLHCNPFYTERTSWKTARRTHQPRRKSHRNAVSRFGGRPDSGGSGASSEPAERTEAPVPYREPTPSPPWREGRGNSLPPAGGVRTIRRGCFSNTAPNRVNVALTTEPAGAYGTGRGCPRRPEPTAARPPVEGLPAGSNPASSGARQSEVGAPRHPGATGHCGGRTHDVRLRSGTREGRARRYGRKRPIGAGGVSTPDGSNAPRDIRHRGGCTAPGASARTARRRGSPTAAGAAANGGSSGMPHRESPASIAWTKPTGLSPGEPTRARRVTFRFPHLFGNGRPRKRSVSVRIADQSDVTPSPGWDTDGVGGPSVGYAPAVGAAVRAGQPTRRPDVPDVRPVFRPNDARAYRNGDGRASRTVERSRSPDGPAGGIYTLGDKPPGLSIRSE